MKRIISLFTLSIIGLQIFAQTSPEPIYLIAGDGTVEFTPFNESMYPYGLQGWVGTNPEVAPNAAIPKNIQAKGNGDLIPTAAVGSTAHWSSIAFNNEGNGISWRAGATGNSTPLAIVMAVNTMGCTGVKIGFTWGCKTNYVNQGKAAICFQYRVGNSGDWSNDSEDSQARFSSTKTANVKETKTVNLPASCNNQELVQVRWLVVRETPAAVGSADRMHIGGLTYAATTRAPEVAPLAEFSYTNDTTVVTFKNESQNIPTSFIWDFGDSSEVSTQSNPKHFYSTLDNYLVTLIVTNSKGSDTIQKMVNLKPGSGIETFDDYITTEVNASVLIDVLANDIAAAIDSAGLSVALVPTNGKATISTAKVLYEPNLDFIGLDSFMYKVCTTPNKDVCDSAIVYVIVGPVGIANDALSAEVKVFPNPNKGWMILNVSEKMFSNGNYTYEIFNSTGMKIKADKISLGESKINLSENANGIYYLRIVDEKQNYKTQKFVIVK